MKFNKGQVNALDFFIAISIISILLVSIMLTWNHYETRISSLIVYNDLLTNAIQASDQLVKSPGNPTNWNSSNVNFIGLIDNDREISSIKLNNFVSLSESEVKEAMKIPHNFYFEIKNDVEVINFTGTPPSGDVTTVKIQRYVYYENEKAKIELTLWE